MNVNAMQFCDSEGSSLMAEVQEHQEILAQTGVALSGSFALVPVVDQESYPGAMQVWSETATGHWTHVTPDGIVIDAECPIWCEV